MQARPKSMLSRIWCAAALAALAAAWLAAPAASAATLRSGIYPSTLTASQEATHVLTLDGWSATCKTQTGSGTLKGASETLSLHPSASECTAFGFSSGTVTTTGCDYSYQLGEEAEADIWSASAEIVCESGKAITIVGGTCEATVGAQALSGTVEVTDETEASPKKDIKIKASLSGIKYTKTKDGIGCPFSGTGEGTTGTTNGSFTVTAENPNNPSLTRDLFVTEAEPPPAFLRSNAYTSTLTAAQIEGVHYLGVEGNAVECSSNTGSGTLEAASESFSLHMTPSGCTAFGFVGANVTTTGCDYHYQLGETLKADQWAAGAEIVCESGKSITISAGGVCEATIGSQALSGTVEATDNTEASPRKDLTIKASFSGIKYTKLKDGFGCPFKGTGEGTSGETSGTFTVTAENPNNSSLQRDLYVADTEPPLPASLHASAYTSTLTAAQIEGVHYLGVEGNAVECSSNTGSGTLEAASESFSLHMTPSGCTAFGFVGANVTTTGCDYHYQLGETLKADQWAAGAEIVCESGKSITISAGGVCEATIGTQALGGTVEVTDNTEASPKKDISIKASLTGIHYTKLKDGFGCPFKGTGEGTSGETSGTFTVTAENPNKSEEKRDLYVAD